jgi:hypothetical protein
VSNAEVGFISEVGRQRLEIVAKWLEAGAPHVDEKGIVSFNMNVGIKYGDCGTTCCIAGAVCQFSKPFVASDIDCIEQGFYSLDPEYGVLGRAIDLLGISRLDADKLFTPDVVDEDGDWKHITPAQAATTIRKYLATGAVDWSHVEPQGEE